MKCNRTWSRKINNIVVLVFVVGAVLFAGRPDLVAAAPGVGTGGSPATQGTTRLAGGGLVSEYHATATGAGAQDRRGNSKSGPVGDDAEHNNIVQVQNITDNVLQGDGNVDLEVIHGPDVTPGNLAWAESSCTDCRTMAVALQLVLYDPGAPNFQPENVAVALNDQCNGCVSVAHAIQYVLPVSHLRDAPRWAGLAVQAMNYQLSYLRRSPSMSIDDAESRAQTVISEFRLLAQYFIDHPDANCWGYSPQDRGCRDQ